MQTNSPRRISADKLPKKKSLRWIAQEEEPQTNSQRRSLADNQLYKLPEMISCKSIPRWAAIQAAWQAAWDRQPHSRISVEYVYLRERSILLRCEFWCVDHLCIMSIFAQQPSWQDEPSNFVLYLCFCLVASRFLISGRINTFSFVRDCYLLVGAQCPCLDLSFWIMAIAKICNIYKTQNQSNSWSWCVGVRIWLT